MQEHAYMDTIKKILEKDPRYDAEAYIFIREAMDFTMKKLNKPSSGKSRHISGTELLDGIREYAIEQFGPIALAVLKEWGISKTEDFGEIVFNLVETGELGRTNEDKRADFANGYDFNEAFSKPFIPADSN